MLFASIDIGSNAGRLMVGNVVSYNSIPMVNKVSLTRVPLRLGFDVFEKGIITREKQDILIRTLDAYKRLIKIYDPKEILICGTAAMREAENAKEVTERIYNETGFNMQIISGEQEARLISSSSNTLVNKVHEYSLYIDVGGGSTELTFYKGDVVLNAVSFNVGTIRMLLDAVERSEWDALKNWIKENIKEDIALNCICSGGNINKLTKMFGHQENNTLTYTQLSDCLMHLEGYSVQDRMAKFNLREDRADVIVPAATIFKKILKWGGIHDIQAPKIGLVDGLIVDLYKKQNGLETIL